MLKKFETKIVSTCIGQPFEMLIVGTKNIIPQMASKIFSNVPLFKFVYLTNFGLLVKIAPFTFRINGLILVNHIKDNLSVLGVLLCTSNFS